MQGINGWLLVYVITAVPVQWFYATALSGWYWDYPMWLLVPIFIVLLVPLALLVLNIPSAPTWNVALLWFGAGLILLRVLTGLLFVDETRLTATAITIMASIVSFAIVWAIVWTQYFLNSDRVARTFV